MEDKIVDFSGLTNFIYSEYSKLFETFGINKPSSSTLDFVDKNIKTYCKLYCKVLIKREKRQIALDEALDTMPKSFFWKVFHPNLWSKMKEILDNEKKETESLQQDEEAESKVVKTSIVPAIITKSSENFVDNMPTCEDNPYDF